MTPPPHTLRVVGGIRSGYTDDPDQELYLEVNVDGQDRPLRLYLSYQQAYDADLSLYMLRPTVTGRGAEQARDGDTDCVRRPQPAPGG